MKPAFLLLGSILLSFSMASHAGNLVKRGEYLVNFGGCDDCHTPMKQTPHGPVPDMSMRLSGQPQNMKVPPAPPAQGPWIWHGLATNTAFAGPWGVTFAANLTPDKQTGLGDWSEKQFIQTMRTGKHMGTGRAILPPMPWDNLQHLKTRDLKAIFAFLRSLPPIRNQVPPARPPVEDHSMKRPGTHD